MALEGMTATVGTTRLARRVTNHKMRHVINRTPHTTKMTGAPNPTVPTTGAVNSRRADRKRGAIQPIRAAYPSDLVDSGVQPKSRPRSIKRASDSASLFGVSRAFPPRAQWRTASLSHR